MKKKINSKVFDKNYAKLLEHPKDNQFFKSCYEEKDGFFYLKDSLEKADKKKLKELYKAIKANRKGPINFIPILIVGGIIAAGVFFFTVIANPLLGNALEKGLESIFEAKSNVRGFRFSLIKFEISVRGITVANADEPMKNLFQMQRTVIKLKPQAVLRGKIYIEEIRADEIRFGTDRTVSGALPGYVRRQDRVKPEQPPGPPLIDLANFDAMALLNQEFDKLTTPKLYDTAITAYNETSEKWQNQVESGKEKVEELRTASAPIMNISASSFSVSSPEDIQKIRDTINDIDTMIKSVQSAADEASKIVSGIESDINMVRQLEQNARNAINDDINHLKSYIDLGSGAAFEAIEPFIMDTLSDAAQQYVTYGVIALDALEKINALSAQLPKSDKPKKVPKVPFKGRDVVYPTKAYPAFYLGVLASDFTIDTWNWSFDLQGVSSDPDLYPGKPVTLDFGMKEDGGSRNREVVFAGSADFRRNPVDRFKVNIDANGFPIGLRNQFDKLGIGGLTGESAFNVNASGQPDKSFSIGADVNLLNASLVEPSGTIAEALDIAINRAGRIDLGIQYSYNASGKDDFKITTNIANLFLEALRAVAQSYVTQAAADIERALRQKIEEYTDGKLGAKEDLDNLLNIARGDRAAINQVKNSLDSKKNELEERIRSAANQAAQQAAQQAGQAVQNVLPSNVPSVPGLSPRR